MFGRHFHRHLHRLLLLAACLLTLGGYIAFESGVGADHKPDACCSGDDDGGNGDAPCPPNCDDGNCCPGQALVVASSHQAVAMQAICIRIAPGVLWQAPLPGHPGKLFRPPRTLS